MGYVLTPQTRVPTAAPPNPMARALHGPIGSGGPSVGGAAGLSMEREGQSRWRVGWRWLMLVVVCVVVVFVCCVCPFSYNSGKKLIPAEAKWLTFACSYQKK